ncbi:MAG: fibronectin type III domain-containing protein, partial [Acidimicrobiales bacterium]
STPLNTTPLTSTAYQVTGLSDGTTYYFEVTTTNSVGEGAPVQVSATPTLPPPACSSTILIDSHLVLLGARFC